MPEPLITRTIPQMDKAADLLGTDLLLVQRGDAPAQAAPVSALVGYFEAQGVGGVASAAAVAAAATATAIAGTFDSIRDRIDAAMTTVDVVGFTRRDLDHETQLVIQTTRPGSAGFTAFAIEINKPVAIRFNAIEVAGSAVSDVLLADRARSFDGVVRTDAMAPEGAASPVVAKGAVLVDQTKLVHERFWIPLRDPVSGALAEFTEADLLAQVLIGFQGRTQTGARAPAGEPAGTANNLTQVKSYYMTTADAAAGAWSPFGDATTLALSLVYLDGLTLSSLVTASEAARDDLGLPLKLATRPSPDELLLPKRVFGMTGWDAFMFNAGLIAAATPRAFNFIGGTGLGEQRSDCWRWLSSLPFTSEAGSLVVKVRHPDHPADVLASGSTLVDVVAANAAASQAVRVGWIGDSQVEDTRMVERMLARATANPGGAQYTMVGTLGAGAVKHEGRGGWTESAYYDTYSRLDAGGGTVINPFITAPGNKFNYAAYLATTGFTAPDVVIWQPWINGIFSLANETAVHDYMDRALDRVDRMIGLTADVAVGSLLEANVAMKVLVATPTPPGASQDGFATGYFIGQDFWTYRRNWAICVRRILDHYANAVAETAGVFVLPLHLSVDPVAGYATAIDPIHCNTTGYNQGGDAADFAINVMCARNWL